MGEARNFKFDVQIDLGKSHLMHDKNFPKRDLVRVQVEFLNFKTP